MVTHLIVMLAVSRITMSWVLTTPAFLGTKPQGKKKHHGLGSKYGISKLLSFHRDARTLCSLSIY